MWDVDVTFRHIAYEQYTIYYYATVLSSAERSTPEVQRRFCRRRQTIEEQKTEAAQTPKMQKINLGKEKLTIAVLPD